MASQNFIDELKYGANCNRLGKFTIDNVECNQNQYLNEMIIKDSIYNNGQILGGLFDRTLDAKLVNKPSTLELESKTLSNVAVGVQYSDSTIEYENFDNFAVETIQDAETNSLTSVTAYGSGTKLDEPYNCTLDFSNNTTHTIYEFYEDVCDQLGLTPTNLTITNGTLVASGNPFTNLESCRVVLEAIEKVSCSFADISWKDETITLKWFSDTIDYEFEPSDYSILEGSLLKYGPVNEVIIGNSQIVGENVAQRDEQSITQNGLTDLFIDEPYFLYTQALRTQALPAIFNKVKGLQYYDLTLTTYYGKPFLKVGDKIRINTPSNEVYDTYVLTHTFTYNGAFKSVIESPALNTEEQKIKNQINSSSIKSRLLRTEIMVDKANGEITSLVSAVEGLEESVDILKVNVDTTTIVIPVNEGNEPTETKTYNVGYNIDYLGVAQSGILPTIIYPDNSHNPEHGYTGITTDLTTDKVISFSVATGTIIQGTENKYTFRWSKTVDGKVYSVTRTIMVMTVSTESEQNVIISDTVPTDTSVLWYDTKAEQLKKYENASWQVVNDFTDDVTTLSTDIGHLNRDLQDKIKYGYDDYNLTKDTTFVADKEYYEYVENVYLPITYNPTTQKYILSDGTEYAIGSNVPADTIYEKTHYDGVQNQILKTQASIDTAIKQTKKDITASITTSKEYVDATATGKKYYSKSGNNYNEYTGDRTGNPNGLGLYEKDGDNYVLTADTKFNNGLQGQIENIIDYVSFNANTSVTNPITGVSHTGVVTIGKSSLATKLRLAADVLFFDLNGTAVAYIATDQDGNTKLYIKDASVTGGLEVAKSISIGNFGWTVEDGSITFGKVK